LWIRTTICVPGPVVFLTISFIHPLERLGVGPLVGKRLPRPARHWGLDVKDGWLRIEPAHGSADVEIPLSPELSDACEAMPKGHLTYPVSHAGKPRTPGGLGSDFNKWARKPAYRSDAGSSASRRAS
jgi:hypothetical protein